MGTIIERLKADGSKAYNAQIVRKKKACWAILHREADTFPTRAAAKRWITNREAALDKPSGLALARSPNPRFGVVIERFLAENKRPYGDTQNRRFITGSLTADLAALPCDAVERCRNRGLGNRPLQRRPHQIDRGGLRLRPLLAPSSNWQNRRGVSGLKPVSTRKR